MNLSVKTGMEVELAKGQGLARTALYAEPREGVRALKLVLVIPRRIPAWLRSLLELAAENPWLEVVAIPVAGQVPGQPIHAPIDLRVFLALERMLLRPVLSLLRRDSTPLSEVVLASCAGVMVAHEARAGEGSQPIVDRLALLKPDLVILSGFADWATALAGTAKWGCWSLDPGVVDAKHAGLPLLASILNGENATPISLELDVAPAPAVLLDTAWGPTRTISFSQHRDQAFVKLPAMVMRVLRKLADGNLPLPPQPRSAVLRLASAQIPYPPGTGWRAFWTTMRYALQWVPRWRRNQRPWFVVFRDSEAPLDPASPQIGQNSALVAPPGDYWADPFVVEHAQRQLVFVEEYVGRRRLGIIVCLERLPDGNGRRLGVVLDEDSHMSYPQVFQWEGIWYMTVENSAARRVSLYRATDFPLGWERVTDLIVDRVCVDATLYRHQGLWYLFGNVSEGGANASDELFLFTSEQLEGPYRPHPCNPVVSDVRRSRPAGQLFLKDGQLIRPAQCCVPVYGAATVFNLVTVLSPTHYSERPISRLDPDWTDSLDGCHTYNRSATLEVLDAHGKPPGNGKVIRMLGSA